jgi:hypothetical protein
MRFPHDPQLPQALDFSVTGLNTRGVPYRSRRSGSNTEQTEHAVSDTVLACIECRRPWLRGNERWRLKVTDDSPRETVPYCSECAAREFGDD